MLAAPLARLLLSSLLLLAAAGAFPAQAQPATLSGVVVQAGTGRPVAFATVELLGRQVGVQATEAGAFVLALPAGLAPTDSLRVASLGFETSQLAVPANATACRLELSALPVPLAEVLVRPSVAPLVRLGPTADGGRAGFGGSDIRATGSKGWQVARKFSSGPAGYLRMVRFYVKPSYHCGKKSGRAPFRVRVYAADGPGGAPGTDLLPVSVLSAATAKGWHEVNLDAYQLASPAAGFYVAMEWLYTAADFGCEYTYYTASSKKEKKTGYSYGQSLGSYLDATPALTWYLTTGYPWQQFPPVDGNQKYANANAGDHRNAAIQAIVQPE